MLRSLGICLTFAAVAIGAFGAGERESIHAGPVYTTVTEFPAVRVMVTVPPPAALAAPPPNVQPSTFSLKVDNGPATPGTLVQALSDTGLGMAAVVVLDASGSMAGGPISAIRAGLVKFTSEAAKVDSVAICTVADETRWDSNWNDNEGQLKVALAGLKPRGSLTRLWDGLLEVLAKYPESPIARRLVVISDGHDEGSQHKLEEVLAAAAHQHVVIDSIGVTRSDPRYLLNLAKLSSASGGVYRMAPTLTILEMLVGGGIKRYRTIPVVTFRPEGLAADGKPHTFQVSWNGAGQELQSAVESQVPDDPKTPQATDPKVEPLKKVEVPESGTTPSTSMARFWDGVPRIWLYIGGGVLLALVAGLITFFAFRKRKEDAATINRVVQPSPYGPSPTQPHPQSASRLFNTGAFGQPKPSGSGSKGSVFMALPHDLPPMGQAQGAGTSTRFAAPSKGRPSAWLECVEGAAAGRTFAVDDGQFWIGAKPNNQLILDNDPTVSGNHGCIVFENDTLGLFDHQSTNGLFVNGQRLASERYSLSVGDRLRVGKSIFVVRAPHDAA